MTTPRKVQTVEEPPASKSRAIKLTPEALEALTDIRAMLGEGAPTVVTGSAAARFALMFTRKYLKQWDREDWPGLTDLRADEAA